MIAFHGTGDNVVPYEGGYVWIAPRPFPDQREWAAAWAARNRCAGRPLESSVAGNVRRAQFSGCARDAEFYTVIGGGHQWPGGRPILLWLTVQMAMMGLPVGSYTDTLDATRLLWAFYREHPLRKD